MLGRRVHFSQALGMALALRREVDDPFGNPSSTVPRKSALKPSSMATSAFSRGYRARS
jgi:hypothetical protein